MNEGEQKNRKRLWVLLGAIFLASFSLIAFEITLSRLLSVLLSYHYVFVVLSMALMGLGLGGISVHFLRPKIFNTHSPSCFLSLLACLFALTISFSVIFIIQISHYDSFRNYFFFYGFLLFIPFFFAGMLLAEVFRRFSEISSRIYGTDLVGAAAGSLGVIQLLDILGGLSTSFLLGGVASMAALLFAMLESWENKKGWIISIGSFLILFILLGANLAGLYRPDIPIGRNPGKEIHDVLYGPSSEGKIIETRWSAFGRTDLVAFGDDADYMDIYIDGTAGSPMYKFHGDLNDLSLSIHSLKKTFPGYFPFLFLREEEKDHVLIIGPGGGRDVLLALMAGFQKITAVEINKDLVDLVRKFSRYNGGIYSNLGQVNIVIDEGRHFLRRQKEKYDLITLSLPVTNSSRSLEGYALTENFLFTTHSIHDYLDHLKDQGQLIVVGHNDAEILRLLSVSLVALNQRGVSHQTAMRQIYILGSDMYPVFVLKKTPFEPKDIFLRYGAIDYFGLESVSSYFPYIRKRGALNPALMRLGTGEISFDDLKKMVQERGYEITPVTDDRPFFYKIESGLPNSVSLVFWSSMIIWLLIVLIPLIFRKIFIQQERHSMKEKYFLRSILRSIVLFSMLGMGFMLIEISFVQRFTLFLGQPVLSLAVLLLSLLGWAGMGSLWSHQLASEKIKKGISIASLSAFVLVLAYVFFLSPFFNQLLDLNLSLRLLATILILGPLGFSMGIPFPLGMRSLKEMKKEDYIPWMWGINGASSVLGSVMAIIIAISFGFTEALLASAGCYLIVFIIFLRS